jgi:hypothetical protein
MLNLRFKTRLNPINRNIQLKTASVNPDALVL